jgi:hypothetical protein
VGRYPHGCVILGLAPCHPRSPKARDRGHPRLGTISLEIGATRRSTPFGTQGSSPSPTPRRMLISTHLTKR